MTAGKSGNAFLDAPVLPALLRFSTPVLLALFLQVLYGAVELWAVGAFCGEADVSAVATGSQTMLIVTGFVTGLSTGTSILLGRKTGEGSGRGAASTIGTSICIFVLLGMLLSAVMTAAALGIAAVMNSPPEAFENTVHYIMICGAGSLFIAGYNLLSAIFRGLGNAKTPLLFVAVACAVNIAGDVILINLWGMGTAGAALATIGAQAVSVLLSLALIKRKGFPFFFGRADMRPDKRIAADVIKIVLPIALQDMCNEISYLILIGLINTLGVTASAGIGVAEKLVMFMLLIPMSYMQSISAFTAQAAGAGQAVRAKKAMWTGMCTAAVLGGVISYATFFHGDSLSRIFIQDPSVIQASAEFLKATAIECFVLSVAHCFTGYYNGLGKTAFVMAQGLCAIFLVKLPFAWVASSRAAPQLFQIGMSTAYGAVFTLTACILHYIYTNNFEKTGGIVNDKCYHRNHRLCRYRRACLVHDNALGQIIQIVRRPLL